MKLFDEGNIGIAMTSGFVETHAGDLHVYADRTQAGNIVFITTDNFKKYIPIEWIKKYGVKKNKMVYTALENVLYWLIKDWEKENE